MKTGVCVECAKEKPFLEFEELGETFGLCKECAEDVKYLESDKKKSKRKGER